MRKTSSFWLFTAGLTLSLLAQSALGAVSFNNRWHETRKAQPDRLTLELKLPKSTFYQGEIIPATLLFSSTSTNLYHMWIGNYDRSGRIPDIGFHSESESGEPVPDPLQWYLERGGIGGGMGNEMNLGEWSITLPANQWLRFERAGTYRLYAWSNRPKSKGKEDLEEETTGIDLVSDIVTIKITPLPNAQEKAVIEKALAAMSSGDENESREAARALRYMQTPAARHAALSLLGSRDDFEASMALIGAPDPGQEAPILLDAACQPDFAVSDNVVSLYAILKSPRLDTQAPPEDRHRQLLNSNEKARADMLSTVRKVIAQKQGEALLTSLLTLLSANPEDQDLRKMLLANMDKMTETQIRFIIRLWDKKIGGEDFLPILRMAATEPRWSPAALGLLARIAPDEARPLIIEDISREKPRYVGLSHWLKPLTELPDRQLPELDHVLHSKLIGKDPDLFIVIQLIDRYATTNLLADVVAIYSTKEGRWACDIQNSALRYWIRSDPEEGVKALGRALQLREKTGCYRNTLSDVLLEQWTTNALPLVHASLEDNEPEVVVAAVKVLEKHADSNEVTTVLDTIGRISRMKVGELEKERQVDSLAHILLDSKRWSLTYEQLERLDMLVQNAWAKDRIRQRLREKRQQKTTGQ